MKKIYYFIFLLFTSLTFVSCLDDNDNSGEIEAWKLENENYFARMKDTIGEDGKKYYSELASLGYPEYKVLYHIVDSGKVGTQPPFFTSTVNVDYSGRLINTTEYFDENYGFQSEVTKLIQGWQIVLQNMPVGSVWQVVIPWELGYGASATSSIPAYSTLLFTIKLNSIPGLEIPAP